MPRLPFLYPTGRHILHKERVRMMKKDKRFALLLGKAFLQETQDGHKDTAIAFGRAFLLALGYEGPSNTEEFPALNGKEHAPAMALANE